MNIGKEYFALIPEAIKQSKKENIHWLKKICEIPGGLSEILYHLSKIDVYSYGLNYSLFFCNLPINDYTQKTLLKLKLNMDDVVQIFIYTMRKNPNYARDLLFKYRYNKLTKEQCAYIITKIDRRNKSVLEECLDMLLEGTTDYIRVYYLCVNYPDLKEKVLDYMSDNVVDVLTKSPVNRWITIANSVHCDNGIIDDFFYENINELIDHYYSDNLLNLVSYLKKYPKSYAYICDYVDAHFKEVFTGFYKNMYNIGSLDEVDQSIVDYLFELLTQIKNYEGVRFCELVKCPRGNFSNVFILGDKVIKLGKSRGIDEIIDTPYVLKPLVRGKLETNHKAPLCYEVTERAVSLETGEIDQEEMYKLYKTLRDQGIVWVDIRENNLGYLLKDNILHWYPGTEYDSESRGMIPCDDDTVLKAGDLIIIDNDHRFKEDEVPVQYCKPEWQGISYFHEFETRYQKEKGCKQLIKKAVNES